MKKHICIAILAAALLTACTSAPQPSAAPQPTATPPPAVTTTPLPSLPAPTATLINTMQPTSAPTAIKQPTAVSFTLTPTLPKPSATRAPSMTPAPTFAFLSKSIKAPNGSARLISFDDSGMWMAVPDDRLVKLDPKTGKTLTTQKFGCKVCFGACDFFTAARDGQFFWAVQYGGIGDQNCQADNPWANVNFSLRKIKIGSEASEAFNITPLLQFASSAERVSIAAREDTVWLSVDEIIYVLDMAKSTTEKVVISKTILPGMAVEGLLFAADTLWAGGDALLAINPTSAKVESVYPLEAQMLAYDGKRIWGMSKYTLNLQAIDLKTREVNVPLYIDFSIPSAIGYDGANIWVAFNEFRDLAVIPAK